MLLTPYICCISAEKLSTDADMGLTKDQVTSLITADAGTLQPLCLQLRSQHTRTPPQDVRLKSRKDTLGEERCYRPASSAAVAVQFSVDSS